MIFGRVREIWRYPVSSMGGEKLESAIFAPGGVEGDRLWGVEVDGAIAAPEKRKVCRPLPDMPARLLGHIPEVLLPGGGWAQVDAPEVAAAVAERLAARVRLAPHESLAPRYERLDIHVLTTAALASLAGWISDPAQADPRRYRPNLVIETPAGVEGLPEHDLVGRRLEIGEVRVEIVEPCARCALPALGVGGLAFLPELIHAVSKRAGGNFGALARIEGSGRIATGDEVRLG